MAHQKQSWAVLVSSLAVCTFLIISASAVVWANGLRYNSQTGLFEQTALVAISGSAEDIAVKLNGEIVADQLPYQARNLLPGRYVVELEKNGFQTWRQSFLLSGGQVGLIADPTLVAREPLITTPDFPAEVTALADLDFGLDLSDGAFTDNGKFITRFAHVPQQIHRYNNYYLYQVGSELRLFQALGSQDYLIYRTKEGGKLSLALYPSKWQMAFLDDEMPRLINLTLPASSEPE